MAAASMLHLEPPRPDPWWELSDDVACVLTPELAVVRVNPAWERLLDHAAGDVACWCVLDVVHPDDAPFVREHLSEARGDQSFSGLEARCRAADGSWRWLAWRGVRGDGLWHCMGRDVTVLRTADPDVDRPAVGLPAFTAALPDGLFVVGDDGALEHVNSRLCEITGLHRDELVGTRPPYPFARGPHGDALAAACQRARYGEPGACELVLERHDGEPVPVMVTASWHTKTAAHGRQRHLVCVVHDATEEVRDRLRLQEGYRVARLAAWDLVPGTGAIDLTIPGSHVAGLGLAPGLQLDEVLSLLAPEDERRLRDALDRVAAGHAASAVETGKLRTAIAAVRWIETRVYPVRNTAGRITRLRGTIQDVSGHREAAREIAVQAQLLDAVDAAVIASDVDGTVTHYNRGAERTYGWTREQAVGQPLADLLPACEGAPDSESEGRRHHGTRFPVFVRRTAFSVAGEAGGAVTVSVDISERVETERRLRAARDHLRAVTDSMGEGLFTLDADGRLTYMNPVAEEILGWSERELLGELMHDRTHYLRADGRRLPFDDCPLMHARRDDRVVRVPEDVFVRKDGATVPVQITAAPFVSDAGGRGSVVVFSDITERKAERARLEEEVQTMTWVARVRQALDEDRLVLYVQPIIDIASRRVVQHELLIRMVDHDGRLIPPGAFLPAAEQDGIIVDVDRWVIGEAVKLAVAGHAVELNLSARSVATPTIAGDFRHALQSTGADPSKIVVELTETAVLEDSVAAGKFLAELKQLGCRLALDDFGTGYGGFTYLKRLPVDYLKIDTEFVRDLCESEASRRVVSAVVSLAQGFGQMTVAEGVEDMDALALLAELGVDYAQGYAIGRPAPLVELLAERGRAA